MDFILLTQNSTPIFQYVVKLLGVIMNVIFEFLDLLVFPISVYLLFFLQLLFIYY